MRDVTCSLVRRGSSLRALSCRFPDRFASCGGGGGDGGAK